MSQQRAVQAQATGKAASPHAIKPRTPVGPMHPILTLNRTIGNKAVQRMIASQKTVSPAAEGYEQRFPATLSIDQVVGRGLNTLGHPLGRDTREFMENKFGFDFGDVRIHNDSHAAESSEAINANAYTIGQDIVFGAGKYFPGSSEGKKLIAHELTHVVQQSQVPSTSEEPVVSHPQEPSEQEAEQVASHIVSSTETDASMPASVNEAGLNASSNAATAPTVSRDGDDDNQESGGLGGVLSSFAGPAVEAAGDVGDALGVPGAGMIAGALGTTMSASEGMKEGGVGSAAKTALGLLNTTSAIGGFGLGEAGGTALGALPEAAAAGELGTLGMAGPVGAVAGAGVAGWEAGKGLDKLSNYIGQQVTGDTKGDYSISGGIGSGLMDVLGPKPGLWLADKLGM
jgi:hypothetical protein